MSQSGPTAPNSANQAQFNLLLAALPKIEFERLLPLLTPVTLSRGDILYEGDRVPTSYFPISGLVSLMRVSEQGVELEVGLVSREGMVGIRPILSGAVFERATVQIEGHAWSIAADDLRAEFRRGGVLHDQVLRHFQAILAQTSQSALCNRLHAAEERLCRWLLTIGDRVERHEFQLESHFMEQLLGTHFDGIITTTDALRVKGLIRYITGSGFMGITIADRKLMEHTACECYRVIRQEGERLFRQPE